MESRGSGIKEGVSVKTNPLLKIIGLSMPSVLQNGPTKIKRKGKVAQGNKGENR
jgi:hypothetical protein